MPWTRRQIFSLSRKPQVTGSGLRSCCRDGATSNGRRMAVPAFPGGGRPQHGVRLCAALRASCCSRAPLWLAVAGATGLGLLFNFMSYGGLVFGRTSLVLLPRFLAFYVFISTANYDC